MKRNNRIPFMTSDNELKAIDKYRFLNCMGSRASAIRILIEKGLASEGAENSNGSESLAAETPVTAKKHAVLEEQHETNRQKGVAL